MGEASRLVAVRIAAIVAVIAILILLLLIRSDIKRVEMRQPQGPTVVYIKDGQGSKGVPTFIIASEDDQVGFLPNFTPVEMYCWQDVEGQRWFWVRPTLRSAPQDPVIVLADHTHNQTEVDHC